MANKIKTRWNCLPGCKTANVMYKTIDRKSAKFLLVLKRRDCRKMIGVLTGHSLVAAHGCRLTDREDHRKCQGQDTRTTHNGASLVQLSRLDKATLRYAFGVSTVLYTERVIVSEASMSIEIRVKRGHSPLTTPHELRNRTPSGIQGT